MKQKTRMNSVITLGTSDTREASWIESYINPRGTWPNLGLSDLKVRNQTMRRWADGIMRISTPKMRRWTSVHVTHFTCHTNGT